MTTPYASSRNYWRRFGWAVLTAVLAAAGAFLYIALVDLGTEWLWPAGPVGIRPFSGSWRVVVVMTAVGLLVGLMHRYLPAREIDVFDAIEEGQLPPKLVPGSLLVALASLIGGFSLGPEVPAGILAGGLATWLAERSGWDEESRRTNILGGVLSAYSGLFSSPFATVVAALELPHKQSRRYFGTLTITAVAAVVGFALFFIASGQPFGTVLRILDLPVYELALWHIPVGVVLGAVGAALALVFGWLLRLLARLFAPLNQRPIVRGGLGGFLLGLLALALPLTMFLGTDGLVIVTEQAVGMGTILLLVLVFAKMLATAGALSAGFIGGPIFPLFFVGGAAGTALHLLFPAVPLALSVSCLMTAVPAALLPIPFTLALVVLLVTGIPATEAIPVFLAGLVANFVTHGFGLLAQERD